MKEKKYKYEWTVEETTTDTRVHNIKSNINLSREELVELACQVEECPGEKYKEDEVEVTYEETIYGNDAVWNFTEHSGLPVEPALDVTPNENPDALHIKENKKCQQ